MILRSLPFLHVTVWCGSLALLSSCAVLGGAGKAKDSGSGAVNRAFHDAFYTAQVAKLKGDQNGAKEALLACLDADPDEAIIHYELARLEREAGQWAAAHAAILEANALDGDNPWYHTELADIALELGLYEDADAALEWVLQNKPEDDRSARLLLDLRTAQGNLDGALRVVDVLEREWGPDPEWHFDRHRLFMGAGDFEAGLEALVLGAVADAAVDGQHAHTAMLAERGDLDGHLVRELTSRQHDERLRRGEVAVDRLDDRDPEGPGLPASGAGLDDQVGAFAHERDGLGLDGHRVGPAEVPNPGLHVLGAFRE